MNPPLRPSPIGTPWVSGAAEFGMDKKELRIQFEVQHGILEPCQNLTAKGGRLVDANKLKVVGEIAMWGESHRRDRHVVR